VKIRVVSAGARLRALDKKGRTIADIPLNFSSTEARRLLEAHAAKVPCPSDPDARLRWAGEALGLTGQ